MQLLIRDRREPARLEPRTLGQYVLASVAVLSILLQRFAGVPLFHVVGLFQINAMIIPGVALWILVARRPEPKGPSRDYWQMAPILLAAVVLSAAQYVMVVHRPIDVFGLVLVAVGEECAFRLALTGLVLALLARCGLNRRYAWWAASVVSSVVFAACHQQVPYGFVGRCAIFGFGLMLCAIVWRTGRLLPAMAFHFVYDATTLPLMMGVGSTRFRFYIASLAVIAMVWPYRQDARRYAAALKAQALAAATPPVLAEPVPVDAH